MPTEPNTLSPRDARSSASLAALPEIRFACSSEPAVVGQPNLILNLARPRVRQTMRQRRHETRGFRLARLHEYLARRPRLYHHAVVQKHHVARNRRGEPQVVRRHQHRHAFGGELLEHFHHFRRQARDRAPRSARRTTALPATAPVPAQSRHAAAARRKASRATHPPFARCPLFRAIRRRAPAPAPCPTSARSANLPSRSAAPSDAGTTGSSGTPCQCGAVSRAPRRARACDRG